MREWLKSLANAKNLREFFKISADYFLFQGIKPIRKGITKAVGELWHDRGVVKLKNNAKKEYRRAGSQLKIGAIVALVIMILGMVIVRIGYAVQPEGVDQFSRDNYAGWLIRCAGGIVSGLGTLWAACWLGVVVVKKGILISVLRMTSQAWDRVRLLVANLTSDLLLEDKLFQSGELLSKEEAEKIWRQIVSIYVWIITFGMVLQLHWILPFGVSLGIAIVFFSASVAAFAAAVALKKDSLTWAYRINLVAIAGVLVCLFLLSPAWALVSDRFNLNRRSCYDEYIARGAPKDAQRKSACERALGKDLVSDIEKLRAQRLKSNVGRDLLTLNMMEGHVAAAYAGKSFEWHMPACADGIDNDGDGLVDFDGGPARADNPQKDAASTLISGDDAGPADSVTAPRRAPDPACRSFSDDSEHRADLPCDDGKDNDANGAADREDPNCWSSKLPCSDKDKANALICRQGARKVWYRYSASLKEQEPPKTADTPTTTATSTGTGTHTADSKPPAGRSTGGGLSAVQIEARAAQAALDAKRQAQ